MAEKTTEEKNDQLEQRKIFQIGEVKGTNIIIRIGVGSRPPKGAYKHDIIHFEMRDKNGKLQNAAVMTPKEAVVIGVHLIRATILADFQLQRGGENVEWATNWEQNFEEKEKIRDKELKRSVKL